ncbi:MAG: HAD-IIIC family phosphatase [Planctomycetota bacterium]
MSSARVHRWHAILDSLRDRPAADFLALTRAGRELERLITAEDIPEGVSRARVIILRSTTVEVLVPAIVAEFAARGVAVSLSLGEIGNHAAETFDARSPAYTGQFDAVVLWVDAESAVPAIVQTMSAARLEDDAREFVALAERLATSFRGSVVVATLAAPDRSIAPHFQANDAHSARYAVEAANRQLAGLTARHANLAIWDIDRIQRQLGHEGFWSPRDAATAMQPYSSAAIPRLARSLADVHAMTFRSPAKVIVLDCDNTLWGGIVGEDGIDGIALGEAYPGTMFERFQRQLRQLGEIGFVLAINSKNNEADVREVFDSHTRTVLGWDDFSVTRVNWQDKVANLEAIAEHLNLGTDSIVFIDDNEFELQHVAGAHPAVTTIRVPSEPYAIPAALCREVRLDRLRLTAEDRKKSEQYAQERQRTALRESFASYDEYLQRLDMVLKVEPFSAAINGPRAAQLTQKTNQFNLTTRRYTAAELEEATRTGATIFLASLRDRVGDYGRIALAIVRADGDNADLDTFLMSCRAIGRGVETRFLGYVVDHLAAAGVGELRARFIPSARNAMCREFLDLNGFECLTEDADGTRYFRLRIGAATIAPESAIRLEIPPS